ncbi:MAG: anthranilate phosphoribosyltransferase [Micavibrio aeruginosavorus]|uniref:Anthranilate phosphoribosyltransferase n=1 Tax=Micavibrio aeruginosavorus TaxID=349221 RepID=A0A2W5HHK0_9BACT|nr:MAG: anthranilate phosphoribosyltransferase [Micavibrio aeruginosavorus]
MVQDILIKIRSGLTLGRHEMYDALSGITEDKYIQAQIGAFLMGLSLRGETPEEIIGAVGFLKDKVEPISASDRSIDCCGTGGDASGTYNISTAAALILAGCGVPVAKHGNRAASSKSGAADVLEALGVNLVVSKEGCEKALKEINFCFLMAPHHHTVLKPLAALRKELGFRTIFNLLGPLANPANTKRQLIGVYDRKLLPVFAEVLRELGAEKAWIVHGEDGLDEITLTSKTYCTILDNGNISEKVLTPDDFGFTPIMAKDIEGGLAQENAKALMALLQGEKSSYRNIVLANAAAALMVSDKVDSLKDGVAMAAQAIDDGRALSVLNSYRDFTNHK